MKVRTLGKIAIHIVILILASIPGSLIATDYLDRCRAYDLPCSTYQAVFLFFQMFLLIAFLLYAFWAALFFIPKFRAQRRGN